MVPATGGAPFLKRSRAVYRHAIRGSSIKRFPVLPPSCVPASSYLRCTIYSPPLRCSRLALLGLSFLRRCYHSTGRMRKVTIIRRLAEDPCLTMVLTLVRVKRHELILFYSWIRTRGTAQREYHPRTCCNEARHVSKGIISGLSSPGVLTDKGIINYARAIGLYVPVISTIAYRSGNCMVS